jgi:hypothetical protein
MAQSEKETMKSVWWLKKLKENTILLVEPQGTIIKLFGERIYEIESKVSSN